MKTEKRYLVPGDYMADPALVATADVVKGMPEKDTENKLPYMYLMANCIFIPRTIGKVVLLKMIMAIISI